LSISAKLQFCGGFSTPFRINIFMPPPLEKVAAKRKKEMLFRGGTYVFWFLLMGINTLIYDSLW
jgi:hypothetical protein